MNIVAFFAHPDDETILAGGVLALCARAGAQVHVLCATRGEGGEAGDPPVTSLDKLGELREQELVCAVQALGGRSLTFLGYNDPRVGSEDKLFPYTENLARLAGQIAATVRQFNAEVLLTHGLNGEYGHPAHILSYQAAYVATASMGAEAPLLYCVSASFEGHPLPRLANPDQPAHLVLDVSSVMEMKAKAARCHKSQNALFVRRASQEAGRAVPLEDVLMRLESLHRAYPALEAPPEDALARLLQPWTLQP